MLRMTSDPSFDITGMPPNMGNFPLKHVDTFSGRASNFALAYLPSDEAIQHSWQNAKAMRNDVGIAECIEARQRCTALLDWHLEPENDSSHEQKELCAELTKIIERIPRFVEYRNNLMHAIWYGKYAIQNRYRWVSIEGRDRVMPARVRDSAGWLPINGDKLVFRFDDGDPLKADQLGIRVGAGYGIGGDFNGYKVERAEPTGQGLAYFLPDWQRDALCVHKHMIEDADWEDPRNAGTIHGVGIRSRIYWEWFQKQNALAFLMEYLERSAGGMEVWTYPAGDPTALANAKAAARERMGNGRNIIFFPKPLGEAGDMYDVRIIEAGMAGIESLKDILITYFGHRIKRYILGQTLSTEAEATGLGSGVADLHLDSLLQIVKYDATNLEETLTYDLVRNLKNWNFPWARGIHVRFVIDTESPEVEKKLQAWMQAWQMGAKLKASDVMELIGASPPGPDDEVLQQPQQMGGMPGQEPGGNQFAGVDLNELAERAKQQVTTAIAGTPEPERYSVSADEAAAKTLANPSEAQKKSGNYQKGKFSWNGMSVSIENPKGGTRSGKSLDGVEWSVVMPCHYGYILGTEGKDGDHVDVFIGPETDSEIVFVIDQNTPSGRFDEHKAFIGFRSQSSAEDAYLKTRTDDGRALIRSITPMTVPQFKAWINAGETSKPLADQVSKYSADFDESKVKRDDDGKFAEKEGTGSEESKPKAKPKGPIPGSQLPQNVLDKLKSLGVKDFPPADIPLSEITIADLSQPDGKLRFKSLLKWKQVSRNGRTSNKNAYTPEFHERNAKRKWARVGRIEPFLGKIGNGLSGVMNDTTAPQRQREAAAIANVIMETGLRPTDSKESIKHGHYGISSLRVEHVKFSGNEIHLDFIGKEGVRNQTIIRDPKNVAFIKNLVKNKGKSDTVFGNANSKHSIALLKNASVAAGGPKDIMLKDLRTIKATNTARKVVQSFKGPPPPFTGDKAKDVKLIKNAILTMSGDVAKVLNNTPQMARDNYIHPEVFKTWQASLKM